MVAGEAVMGKLWFRIKWLWFSYIWKSGSDTPRAGWLHLHGGTCIEDGSFRYIWVGSNTLQLEGHLDELVDSASLSMKEDS